MTPQKFSKALGNVHEGYVDEASTYTRTANTPRLLKWGSLVACFCLVLVATVFFLKGSFPLGPEVPDPKYGYTIAYVGSANALMSAQDALNLPLLESETDTHLPIFRIDTFEELNAFRQNYQNAFSSDTEYDGVPSFNGAMAKAQWDREIFYEENSLLIVYVPANSGSLRFGIQEVQATDTTICIQIEQTNQPDVFTEDEAGWFVLIEIDSEEVSSYTSFDAILK